MADFVPAGTWSTRLTFGRERDLVELPDLVEVQRDSFRWFFQFDTDPEFRQSVGLQELFDEIFPIDSYDGSFALEFVRYYVGVPNITDEEARQRDQTWDMPVRATIVW
jgi:DNA-directed RNA polymerase subunit beta